MISQILSLNIGGPEDMEWQGKKLRSSMLKRPTPGPLVVHLDGIEGNSFANPQAHGAAHSILYAYGMPSAELFAQRVGRASYEPGAVGETLTLDALDEKEISVGDVFEIGSVLAQATYPRIPCGKVDYRMQHPQGRQAMVDCGRSGVYFRILRPGKILRCDSVKRVEQSPHSFSIFRLYELVTRGEQPTAAELATAKQIPAFLQKQIERWERE